MGCRRAGSVAGSVQGRCRVGAGSVQGRCRVGAGSVQGRCRVGAGGDEGEGVGLLLPRGFRRENATRKQTTCALELDVCVSDIANTETKKHAVDITVASMEEQIVDSLVPMWAAERVRQGRVDVAPTAPDVGERDVQQIDSKTVAYWRDKFREAEEKRVKADDCLGGAGTGVAVAAANETFGSQWQSQRQSQSQSEWGLQWESQWIARGVHTQPLVSESVHVGGRRGRALDAEDCAGGALEDGAPGDVSRSNARLSHFETSTGIKRCDGRVGAASA